MNPSDISSVIHWWLVILILGTGFLPLTFVLFNKFFDKGYIFSKLLGIIVTSYAIFLLGVLHINPFTQIYSFIIFVFLAVLFFILIPDRKNSLSVIKQNWGIFIFEELLFLGGLFSWAYIHAFNPDIHGLEKYMDFGFINSILRSDYFPPKDMWFTPFPINYYYFGHITTAVLTKLSGIPSNITFNLMLSTIFAFSIAETFSLGANLYSLVKKSGKFLNAKRIVSGLLTAFLVTLAGNLHILYAFFKPYQNDNPVPLWQLPFMPLDFPNSYWYPNATRFIYNTIHEFPIYSWVVADLHGHVLDIPFVLLTIAVLLSVLIKSETSSKKSEMISNTANANSSNKNEKRFKPFKSSNWNFFQISNFGFWHLLLIGFLLAIMYMTNAWDGAIYLLLSGLVLLAINFKNLPKFLLSIFIVLLSLVVFSIPYSYFFKPFASGIGILCSPEFLIKMEKIGPLLFEADRCQHSPWWQLLMLYGFFYFFVLSFMAFSYKTKKLLKSDIFVFILIILSTFLIILPEFIYLKDIYPAHYRANTMFKLVFQAFIMLSLSSGYIIVRLVSSIKYKVLSIKEKILATCFLILTTGLIVLVMTYPYLAIKSYYGDLKTQKNLDGTTYLKTLYPSDYQAILWLNENVKNQPVILEAQSDSYTDFGRVSANTGLPTVLGWTVHEWLWRGSYDIPEPRINEIKTLYETADPSIAKQLLSKHEIEYVFIGALEYQKYENLSEEKFEELGKLIYQNQNTKIYKID